METLAKMPGFLTEFLKDAKRLMFVEEAITLNDFEPPHEQWWEKYEVEED